MNMFPLTLRYMKKQKKRTILTVIGIILAVALVSASGILITSFIHMRLVQDIKQSGTWHYRVNQISDKSKAELLKSNVLIQKAGVFTDDHYLQIKTNKKDETNFLKLRELDTDALSMMPYVIEKGRMPKSSDEIAIQSNNQFLFPDKIKIGDRLTLPFGSYSYSDQNGSDYNNNNYIFTKSGTHSYTVVGFYKGGGSYWQNNTGEAVTLNPTGKHSYSCYVQMKPGISFKPSLKKALKDCGIPVNVEENGIVEWMGQSSSSKVRDTVGLTFLLLAVIILSAMLLVIRNSFAMSVSEKISQIGTFRCLGAAPGHIRNLVLSEAIIIWLIALPIGLLSGLFSMFVVIEVVRSIGAEEMQYLTLTPAAWPFFTTALLSFVAVMFSALIPARRTMKISMVDAVRGNAVYKDDRIKKNKKGRILFRLFGFSGLLAAKNIRRNKKRFRTTIISVIVSVTLFIAVGGFAIGVSQTLRRGMSSMGMDYIFTADLSVPKASEDLDRVEPLLKSNEFISRCQRTKDYNVQLDIPISRVPQDYLNILKNFGKDRYDGYKKQGVLYCYIEVEQISRKNYNSLHFSGKAPTYDELLKSGGALFCQTQTFISGGGRIAKADFSHYKPGDMISVKQDYTNSDAKQEHTYSRNLNVKIEGILSEAPWYANGADGYLIVPDENIGMYSLDYFKKYGKVYSSEYLNIQYVKGKEDQADAFVNQIAESVKNAGHNSFYASNKNQRNDMLIMQIFVYGFVTVIILICCVNVFNTINANLLMRKREIAMTRAIGMDRKQLSRMLLLECALYGMIGTFWGALLGIPLQLLLQRSFGYLILADLQSPLCFVIISLIATIALGLLAGISPIRKMAKASIIEEIRAQE